MAKASTKATTVPISTVNLPEELIPAAEISQKTLWNKIMFGSLIAVFVLMTIMSFSYGLSGDEVDMNEYGKAILKYFLSFGSDQTVFNMPKEYNRDGVIQYYGGLFDLICAMVNSFSPFEEYTTRHILNAWAGFLAIFFTAKIARHILNEQAATIAIWMMFASPFFLGHAMNNPKDIPFAAAYIMAIWNIIRLFNKLPNASKWDYVWAILSIGATINVRVGGILLIPYLFVFAGIIYFNQVFVHKKYVMIFSFAKPVFIVAIAGYFCGSLLWPYGLQSPLNNPLTALSEMSNFKVNILQLFEGTKIYSGELPNYYLPKSILITSSYALLTGLALMAFFIWSFRKSPQSSAFYFVVFTAIFPLFYIIYSKSNVYHAWRHILFIFPSMIVIACFGWEKLLEYLDSKKIKLVGYALLGFLILEPSYFIIQSFPNTITYHNQMVGGVKGAYTNYEMDYYYNSLKQSADWFKKNVSSKLKPGDTVVVLSNAAHLLKHYFEKEPNVKLDYVRFLEKNQKPWDYVIMHIALIPNQEIKNKSWLPEGSTLFTANIQQCALSAVIKRPSDDDLKGYQMLSQQKADSALFYFDNYLKKDPKSSVVLNTYGNVLLQLNRIDSAYGIITRSYLIDSTNMETRQLFGMASLQKNDFAQAQSIFSKLVEDNPEYPKTYFYLGLAQMGSGQIDAALMNLSKSSQDPEIKSMAFKYMGDIYMKQGKQQEAMKLYQQAGIVQ